MLRPLVYPREGADRMRLVNRVASLLVLASVGGLAVAEEPSAETTDLPVIRVAKPDTPAQAPPAPSGIALDEIVVTAEKRARTLDEVPIAMSVFTDDFLAQEGMVDLQDLATYSPNTNINVNAILPDIRIRGFGSDPSNRAFDQSVGLSVDGISYGRPQYFDAALFDVERIEVLRGPQGTLFGRNTTAGVVNVVTNGPGEERDVRGHARLGDYNHRLVEAAYGDAFAGDGVRFRLAGVLDHSDGYMRNTTRSDIPGALKSLHGFDREGVRAKLEFPDVLGTDVSVGYERVDVDLAGAAIEYAIVPEGLMPFYQGWDPNFDAEPGNYVGSQDFPVTTAVQADSYLLHARRPLGEWRIELDAGHALIEVAEKTDFDMSPAPMLWGAPRDEDNSQSSAELRLASPELGGVFGIGSADVLFGAFYQRRSIDMVDATFLDDAVALEFVAAQGGAEAPLPLPIPLPGPPGGGPIIEKTFLYFDQAEDSFAGFVHGNWRWHPDWALQAGLRYGVDRKEGHWQRVFPDGAAPMFQTVIHLEAFTADADRHEESFSPKVAFQYSPSRSVDLFASWSRGFKSGGFNAWLTPSANPDLLEYEPERVTSWELGAKSWTLDRTLRADLTLFWTELHDYQSVTDSSNNLGQYVQNAALARSTGVELDLTWGYRQWLLVRAAAGYDLARFIDFKTGDCPPDQSDTDEDGDPRCDQSGDPLVRTPLWKATLTPRIDFPVVDIPGLGWTGLSGVVFSAGTNVEYQSEKLVSRYDDPRGVQPEFVRVDASLGFGDGRGRWSFGVSVKNLTDEVVLLRRDDAVLSAEAGGPGAFWQAVEPPRWTVAELRANF